MKCAVRIGAVWLCLWGVPKPVIGHTAFPRQVRCPLDEKVFTVMVTASYTTFKTLRDFQKQGALGNMYETTVNACPQCHFAGYLRDFDTLYTGSVKTDLQKLLQPYKKTDPDKATEIEIAAKIHLYFKDRFDHVANLYLLGSYILKKEDNNIEKRKSLQQEAVRFFKLALDSNEYSKQELIPIIWYLIAELERRCGHFEIAITFFDKALAEAKKEDWLWQWATEQKKLAEEKDERNDI